MKIAIYVEEGRGFVYYDPSTRDVMVTHPNMKVRQAVRKYLMTERPFIMSFSKKKGSRTIVYETANNSVHLMEMGLSEMFHNIGVHVDWGDKDNEGSSMGEYKQANQTEDANAIIKSLDSYDFI